MALRALPPGLPPDEVEKLRWQTFGHKKAHRVASKDAYLRFVQKRRFVLLAPIPGTHYPSVLEAAVGRPLLDFVWDEQMRTLEGWKNESIRAQLVVSTAVLAKRPTMLAPVMLADFLAARESTEDLDDTERRCVANALSPDATTVCRQLDARGALPERELRVLLRFTGPTARRRLRRALDEALAQLLIVEVDFRSTDHEFQEPVYDLLCRAFATQIAKVDATRAKTARERIVCRYLRNVLVEGSHEIARLLGWSEEQTLETCRALVRKRMALSHPASRFNRHLFQATATDLLETAPPSSAADGAS